MKILKLGYNIQNFKEDSKKFFIYLIIYNKVRIFVQTLYKYRNRYVSAKYWLKFDPNLLKLARR